MRAIFVYTFLLATTLLLASGCGIAIQEPTPREKVLSQGMQMIEERIAEYMSQHEGFPETLEDLDLANLPAGIGVDDFVYTVTHSTNGKQRSRYILSWRDNVGSRTASKERDSEPQD